LSAPGSRQSFSVDVAGLLEALTEQFPEPLLCVRELVQNAADAAAKRIETDVAYDGSRGLLRLSVRDDGRGMNAKEIETYLTIGFSDKDPKRQRGRFGVGKLSPYALGISRMVVETCDGHQTHRISFSSDGSGTIARLEARPRGTVVRVYKECGREEAEALAERTFKLVQESCGSLAIPLFVNGTPVNREVALPTVYSLNFASAAGNGVLGVCSEPTHLLMGGGIVLETDAPVLGDAVSYILDSPRLSPTLSRNAVRRDQAFDALIRAAGARMPAFTAHVARQLRVRCDRLRSEGTPVERGLDHNDRAALEWLRTLLVQPEDEKPHSVVRDAPVLETADGGLVSANELIGVIRREGRVPISRVPRTREEISGYVDRGIPVLLLYRDLEDFLERQGIGTVDVDGLDDGIEIEAMAWGKGETALADRPEVAVKSASAQPLVAMLVAALLILVGVAGTYWWQSYDRRGSSVASAAGPSPTMALKAAPGAVGLAPSGPAAPDVAAPRPPERSFWVMLAGAVAALSALSGLVLIFLTLASRSKPAHSWLRAEAGAPMTGGESRRRRIHVLSRAFFHPIDFLVARGWSVRASGAKPLSASAAIEGYRELAPEQPIRSGVRLDLDRVQIGFVDLISQSGDANDGRILLRREDRILLNRNHPTVRDLIAVAGEEPHRARLILDVLLATDPDLGKGTDPRQVEWDLLGRAEQSLRRRRW
jgi:hypothetical protein